LEAYKLDIGDYTPTFPGMPEAAPYKPREILATILLSPRLELDAVTALKNHQIAIRILSEKSDTMLLASDEYHAICHARDHITGWGLPDIELLKRIDAAEKVEVAEVALRD
jgi:hypothetical protein